MFPCGFCIDINAGNGGTVLFSCDSTVIIHTEVIRKGIAEEVIEKVIKIIIKIIGKIFIKIVVEIIARIAPLVRTGRKIEGVFVYRITVFFFRNKTAVIEKRPLLCDKGIVHGKCSGLIRVIRLSEQDGIILCQSSESGGQISIGVVGNYIEIAVSIIYKYFPVYVVREGRCFGRICLLLCRLICIIRAICGCDISGRNAKGKKQCHKYR